LQRATTEPRRESYDYREWRERQKETWCRHSGKKRPIEGQWIAGAWEMPYQREADAVEQAAELADRFRRAYHASIRALRDWRRYPVVIQNAEQVNIAAEGGQQVNVKGKGRKEATGKCKQREAKQLSAKKESIRMTPALESITAE
jgi:hypothetical protein